MLEAARLALGVTPQLIARTRVTERTAVLDKLLPALIQMCEGFPGLLPGASSVLIRLARTVSAAKTRNYGLVGEKELLRQSQLVETAFSRLVSDVALRQQLLV
ncbi:MAG: hypothetical protein CML43_14680 [Rhodobacteraceae bacterium]|nr:hypothetical protein [Paracoccaceae bacterium]